ncbi:hypothetical protein [Streptomyces sp. NBC_00872]|uniref:hypothetical protein n=1 Tax=Streptomyces sp. NBC_00872 TaxID=2903686 RepID=UPI0038661AD4|nr:hypothetical protein OG214_29335 [Streptomyces sp. NBC_00872]
MAETQQVDPSDQSDESGEDGRAEDGRAGGKRAPDRRAARAERRAARLARSIASFARRHGGAEGRLSYLGQAGTRIVLVGEDGGWGDLVAPTYDVARVAAEKAGLTLHESFDGDFAAKVRTGPYEWKRMAGIQLGG